MASERTKLDVLVEQQKILQDQIWIAEINRDVIKEMMGEDHKDAKKQDLEEIPFSAEVNVPA